MTLVTDPNGVDFDVSDFGALAYYRREPGFVVHDGVSAPLVDAPDVPAWEASRQYVQGQTVSVADGLAVALSDHISGSSYATDLAAGKWLEVLSAAKSSATYLGVGAQTQDAPGLGLYFPEAHGAAADGTTDDSTAINAAINAANTAGKGTVYLRAATYGAASSVALKDNVRIQGVGAALSKIKALAGLTTAVVLASSGDTVSDASLIDLTIDGDYSTNSLSVTGAQLSAVTRLKVHRCTVQNTGQIGVLIQLASADCEVDKCLLQNTGQASGTNGFGVLVSGSNNCKITNNYFKACNGMSIGGNTNALYGLVADNFADKSGCPTTTVSGTGQSTPFATLTVASTALFPSSGALEVAGVGLVTYTGKTATTFTGCTGGSGAATDGGTVYMGYENVGITSGCTGWVIRGNTLTNSRDNGISASAAQTVVQGNVIDTALYHGISVGGGDCVVTGNLIRNVGSSTGAYAGVCLNGVTNCVIVGNRIVDDRGGSAKMQYGVKEVNPAGGHRYQANRVSGATSGEYLLLSNTTAYAQVVGAVNQTYSASMTPDASSSVKKKITATNGTAFTINNPTNGFPGAQLVIDILNSSGGALGTITWGTAYKMAGAFTTPADTKRRTIAFFYDGTDWVETGRAAADI